MNKTIKPSVVKEVINIAPSIAVYQEKYHDKKVQKFLNDLRTATIQDTDFQKESRVIGYYIKSKLEEFYYEINNAEDSYPTYQVGLTIYQKLIDMGWTPPFQSTTE